MSTEENKQPAVQGEPYGYVYSWVHSSATGKPDETFTGFAKSLSEATRHPAHFDIRAVFTRPQPERVALTDEQAMQVMNDLEEWLNLIEDEDISDKELAGKAIKFILDRVDGIKK